MSVGAAGKTVGTQPSPPTLITLKTITFQGQSWLQFPLTFNLLKHVTSKPGFLQCLLSALFPSEMPHNDHELGIMNILWPTPWSSSVLPLGWKLPDHIPMHGVQTVTQGPRSDHPMSSMVDQEGNAGWDLHSRCWKKNQDMSSFRQSTTCLGQPCLLPLTCSWLTFNFSHSPWPRENSHGQWDSWSSAESDSSKLGRFNKSMY